ncbi:unnamed protein product [Macrosiphum euphorbiae]|uniref:Secreted protein n=1 Tax=Macrosiphum euphorbiae TaxID=13131 RepID=A0AAV0W279_9HEMI|nr:unnamed protein product [Macrosiphum euphorbiae]
MTGVTILLSQSFYVGSTYGSASVVIFVDFILATDIDQPRIVICPIEGHRPPPSLCVVNGNSLVVSSDY